MMMKVELDTEAGSRAIADGTLQKAMQSTHSQLRPEAAYFGPEDGMRTAYIVFDLESPAQLPQLTEPLFRMAKAKIKMFPVMDQADLQEGLGRLGGAG